MRRPSKKNRAGFNEIFQEVHDLYKDLAPRVLELRFQGTIRRQDLSDIAQEFFRKIARLEIIARYDPTKPAKSWLNRVLINQAVDFLRAKRRMDNTAAGDSGDQGFLESRPDTKAIIPSSHDWPKDEWEKGEDWQALKGALAGMDVKLLKVLRDFASGLEYRKIADLHRIPIGTVKSRISWARNQIHRSCHSEDLLPGKNRAAFASGISPLVLQFMDDEIQRKEGANNNAASHLSTKTAVA